MAETENILKLYLQISHFKVPKHFFIIEDFPRTVTGKIRKVDLKQMAIKQLNIEMKGK